MRHRFTCALLLTIWPLFATAQVANADYHWEEKRNKKGITIYTSSVNGSPYKAVRGVMQITGTIESLVALVEDLPACPDWAAMCKEARIVERVSPVESYAYIYNDVPFPVADRDVYTHLKWSVDDHSGKVTMTSTAAKGGVPTTKAVRLTEAITQWHFTPQENGQVLVENFAHINPNGPTPAWLTNILLVGAPFDTMAEMRKLIEGGAYPDAHIEFLAGGHAADSAE